VNFDIIGQLLIRYSSFVKYWKQKWEYNGTLPHLFIDFEKAYESVRREVLDNISTVRGIPMKLVRLIKCVQTKHIVKSAQVKICLMYFIFRMV